MTESNNTAYTTISVLQNSPNGLAAFNITAYDGAGNEFNITQNDASANVIIDTANPTLSNVNHIQPTHHLTCKLDDICNITFANEDLSSANITILVCHVCCNLIQSCLFQYQEFARLRCRFAQIPLG